MTTRIPTMYGRYYVLSLIWRGREYDITVFRSKLQKLQRPGAQRIANSVYPGSRVTKFHESDPTDGPVVLTTEAVKKKVKAKKKHVPDDGYYESDQDKEGPTPSINAAFAEEAPKGAKYDRMVKHIKKSYSKDGNLTKGEEGIAYATAWKHKNKKKNEEVTLEHNDGSAKNCKKGEYFCKQDHKCKPIPKGHHVMKDGTLMKGETHKESAWQRKEGKNKSGGLNEKGRKSYERENPGSDLKRPSKKKGNKRRASFCARMRGMKKKLTSKKTARDPDSRINKSLRAWDC